MPKTHRVDKDVMEFCGWPRLMSIINQAHPGRDRTLVATLFLTGGRISEVLLLKKENFDLSHEDVIVVKSMPLVKRFQRVTKTKKWKCVSHCNKRWGEKPSSEEFRTHEIQEYVGWATKPLKDYRTFPIVRKDPPVPILEEWLNRIPRKELKLFSISRVQAFLIIRGLGENLYPHWFRAQRACQLAYEYDYDLHDLMDFFVWKDFKIAMHYSRLGWKGLAKKMGVKV